MENNQNPNRPQRKQLAPRDMIIVAVAILVITRIDFGNLNSFHVLILFLLFLMLMLRWGNLRKEAARKQAMERYREQYETDIPVSKSEFRWADSPAETVAAEDITVDSEPISTEAAPASEVISDEPAEEIPSEEKTAE